MRWVEHFEENLPLNVTDPNRIRYASWGEKGTNGEGPGRSAHGRDYPRALRGPASNPSRIDRSGR